ncbi:MAG: sigma-70 family RNA polymerase sigma factor [Deltaproteobacteria bacterium]
MPGAIARRHGADEKGHMHRDQIEELSSESVEESRRRLFDEARASFPAVQLEFEAFCAHLDDLGYLNALPKYGPSVFLCAACGHGMPVALRVLEDSYFPSLRRIVGSIDSRSDVVDEILQRTRERLFVSAPRRISSYRGSGPLSAWLSVIASNAARDYLREKRAEICAPVFAVACFGWPNSSSADTPEAAICDERHRKLVRCALNTAVASLRGDERKLLHLHFICGLNIDDLGKMWSVHRSTIARRVQRVLAKIRRCLLHELAPDFGVLHRTELGVLLPLVDHFTLTRVDLLWGASVN